jgi:hypothetical protein
MKTLIKLFLAFVLLFTALDITYAQNTKKEKQAAKAADTRRIIENMNYVFNANYALPLRGGQKNLTSEYDLRVAKDTVIAFLPYYGRAYTAPNDLYPNEGGIKFKSTNFSYAVKQRKNGNWQILIKPKDKDKNIANWRDVQQLTLDVSPDGYASLQVISSNRDPISFQGDIREIKAK